VNNTEYNFEDYPLGVTEIAQVLGVKKATVSQWLQRNILPKPDASVNGGRTKIWKLKNIIDWANATGRNRNKSNYESAKKDYISTGHYWRYDKFKTTDDWNNWQTNGKSIKTLDDVKKKIDKTANDIEDMKEHLEKEWDSLGKFAESEEE
jgi:DNA-directed RNA polymerase specialized sigma subunit